MKVPALPVSLSMLSDDASICFLQGKGKRRWAFLRDTANRESIPCPARTIRNKAGAVAKAGSDAIEMAIATTAAAEAAVATARAALEALPVVRRQPFQSMLDHRSAIIIQTAFRGYLVTTNITTSAYLVQKNDLSNTIIIS